VLFTVWRVCKHTGQVLEFFSVIEEGKADLGVVVAVNAFFQTFKGINDKVLVEGFGGVVGNAQAHEHVEQPFEDVLVVNIKATVIELMVFNFP